MSSPQTDQALSDRLVEAIQTRGAASFAGQELERFGNLAASERKLLERIVATCRCISKDMLKLQERVLAELKHAGIAATGDDIATLKKNHQQFRHCRIWISVQDIRKAIDLMQASGFRASVPLVPIALDLLARYQKQVTLVLPDADTTRVTLCWSESYPSVIHPALRPSLSDTGIIRLPTWLVRLYPLVRLVRWGFERLGPGIKGLEDTDYLGTPKSLISPLLLAAQIAPEERLYDLGCGNGNVVTHAAEVFGCEAVGIESVEGLAHEAKQRVVEKGLQDRVTIRHQLFESIDLSDADVVFLFLPSLQVARALPTLLKKMRKGSRLLVHEQAFMSLYPPPQQSTPIASEEALTVAHLWQV